MTGYKNIVSFTASLLRSAKVLYKSKRINLYEKSGGMAQAVKDFESLKLGGASNASINI